MATCDMGFDHEGQADAVIPAEAPPVVVEPGPNENDVEIAKIEAEARVETEKLWTDQRGLELATEVESLRGELRGMREVLDRIAPPEPEPGPPPEPVVMPVPEPAPGPEPVAPPPAGDRPKPEKKGGGWWDNYS